MTLLGWVIFILAIIFVVQIYRLLKVLKLPKKEARVLPMVEEEDWC